MDAVVANYSVGTTAEELQRTSAAIAVAIDLYHIGISLGDESNRSIAAELSKMLGGRLEGGIPTGTGKDYLTQFWVGTLLAQSKLNPAIVAYDRQNTPKPDFIIPKRGVRLSVEVKRPKSRKSAMRALSTAASQLYGLDKPGIVVIDATDCMSADPWVISDNGSATRYRYCSDLNDLHRGLCKRVSSYSQSTKYSSVVMLLTYARFWNWIVDGSGPPRRDAGILIRANAFSYIWSAQMNAVTREIQEALRLGIRQLTGNEPEFRFI